MVKLGILYIIINLIIDHPFIVCCVVGLIIYGYFQLQKEKQIEETQQPQQIQQTIQNTQSKTIFDYMGIFSKEGFDQQKFELFTKDLNDEERLELTELTYKVLEATSQGYDPSDGLSKIEFARWSKLLDKCNYF